MSQSRYKKSEKQPLGDLVLFVEEAVVGEKFLRMPKIFDSNYAVLVRGMDPPYKFLKNRSHGLDDVFMDIDAIKARIGSGVEDKPWRLSAGCHRGTLMSRDTLEEQHGSLAECRIAAKRIKDGWTKLGLRVWYMTAYGPDGEVVTIGEEVDYKS